MTRLLRGLAWLLAMLLSQHPARAEPDAGARSPPRPAVPAGPVPAPWYSAPHAWWRPPDAVPIDFVADRPSLRFTIARGETEHPFAYCTGRCGWSLEPGKYWLSVRSTDKTVAGTRPVKLGKHPAAVWIRPREKDAQRPLVPIGFGLIVLGLGTFVYAVAHPPNESDGSGPGTLLVSLGSVITGIVFLGSEPDREPQVRVVRR